jgi:parvulin-like peptidyl-prolyl isomerase
MSKQYYTKTEIIEKYQIKKHLYQSLVNTGKLKKIKVDEKTNYHPIDNVEEVMKEIEERKKLRVTDWENGYRSC